jgi:hypothetical protein
LKTAQTFSYSEANEVTQIYSAENGTSTYVSRQKDEMCSRAALDGLQIANDSIPDILGDKRYVRIYSSCRKLKNIVQIQP